MEPRTLFQQWLNGVRIAHVAHSLAAAFYKLRGRILGVIVTILTVAVGTGIFSTLSSSNSQQTLIIVGIISMIAAILAGLQTFLDYPALASRHQIARVKYGQLRRKMERMLSLAGEEAFTDLMMKEIEDDWAHTEEESPEIPQRFHDAAFASIKKAS